MRGWLPLSDHLLIGAPEARAVAGAHTEEDAAAALHARLAPGDTLVIKQGQAGAHC